MDAKRLLGSEDPPDGAHGGSSNLRFLDTGFADMAPYKFVAIIRK